MNAKLILFFANLDFEDIKLSVFSFSAPNRTFISSWSYRCWFSQYFATIPNWWLKIENWYLRRSSRNYLYSGKLQLIIVDQCKSKYSIVSFKIFRKSSIFFSLQVQAYAAITGTAATNNVALWNAFLAVASPACN